MEKLKRNTLEQDIVDFIDRGGPTITHKSIIERFNVSIEYIKSLIWRLKKKYRN
jgi:transposase